MYCNASVGEERGTRKKSGASAGRRAQPAGAAGLDRRTGSGQGMVGGIGLTGGAREDNVYWSRLNLSQTNWSVHAIGSRQGSLQRLSRFPGASPRGIRGDSTTGHARYSCAAGEGQG